MGLPSKVLFVTAQLDHLGGTEIYLRRLAEGLATRGVACHFWTGGRRVEGPFHHLVDDRLSDALQLRGDRALAREADRMMGRDDFAAVHVSNVFAPLLIGALARHPRSVRYVHDHRVFCPTGPKYYPDRQTACDVHEGLVCFARCLPMTLRLGWQRRSLTTRYLAFRRGQYAARLFRRTLVASRYMQRELEAAGWSADRIEVLPYFVPERAAAPVPNPAGQLRVAFIGRLLPEKGAHVLLEALARLPGVAATLVGTGPQLLAPRVVELGVGDRVALPGALSPADVTNVLDTSHVLVVPSLWPEPFGIVGIEAMARGRAVVATAVGGVEDWMDDGLTGRVVPPGDVGALQTALQQLAADPALVAAMGRAAWERAERYLAGPHLDRMMALVSR